MNASSLRQTSDLRSTDTEHERAYSCWRDRKQAENSAHKAKARCGREQQDAPLVVVVVDELVVAITLSDILRRNDYNAVWFTDAQEALAYAHSGPIDLLLSDLTMPHLDGVDLAKKIHRAQPKCGLFLFSALSDLPKAAERVTSLDLQVHLEAKPLPVIQLLSKVALLLNREEGSEDCQRSRHALVP